MKEENIQRRRAPALKNRKKTQRSDQKQRKSSSTIIRNKTPLTSAIPVIKINGEQKNKNTKGQTNKQPEQTLKQHQQTSESRLQSRKRHQISKKKINFQINYSNFQRQYKNFGNLFVHALNKLSCDNGFLEPQREDPCSNNFPVGIVNVFYGQNIQNYNPYIEALNKIYQTSKGKMSRQMMERIKKLCFIGIAKNHFKSQKYTQTPKYRRVNILIRTYMYENMRSIIQEKAENYENIVFIPCNKGSLSFSCKKFPEELKEICTKELYTTTILNVNKIIQNQYINYKKMNEKKTVTDRWGQNLVHVLAFLFLLIFLFSNNVVFVYILGFLMVVSLLLYILECRQTLSMLGSSKNIIEKIQCSLGMYLKEINSHNMEWKVGEDFYWLQIHYIRKKKRKPFKHTQ